RRFAIYKQEATIALIVCSITSSSERVLLEKILPRPNCSNALRNSGWNKIMMTRKPHKIAWFVRSEERRVGKSGKGRSRTERAEDGIRGRNVTGVQTCALPISSLRHIQTRSNNRINRLFHYFFF